MESWRTTEQGCYARHSYYRTFISSWVTAKEITHCASCTTYFGLQMPIQLWIVSYYCFCRLYSGKVDLKKIVTPSQGQCFTWSSSLHKCWNRLWSIQSKDCSLIWWKLSFCKWHWKLAQTLLEGSKRFQSFSDSGSFSSKWYLGVFTCLQDHITVVYGPHVSMLWSWFSVLSISAHSGWWTHPITKLSDDPNDLEPLACTGNHILLMKWLLSAWQSFEENEV